ncbi:hypothetical protein IWQ62_001437 [Dispira parvispora]|uniref:KHDC4/BBP-like KH-domain type I domain-containing protein n=1 Tax=Dispira parvispora TaxID=1520584 RepID=A0A9W8E4X8_9FUNG|nr:hypothetical protein IWQ62_001437 [Dispira parvispora]
MSYSLVSYKSEKRKRRWDIAGSDVSGAEGHPESKIIRPNTSNRQDIERSSPKRSSLQQKLLPPVLDSPASIHTDAAAPTTETPFSTIRFTKQGASTPFHDDSNKTGQTHFFKNRSGLGESSRSSNSSKAVVSSNTSNRYLQEKVFVGIKADPNFQLRARLTGPQGNFLQHIQDQSRARVFLRGKGSGYIEPTSGTESFEPLYLYITCYTAEGLETAKSLCQDLVNTVAKEHERFKQTMQLSTTAPTHTGYSLGSSPMPCGYHPYGYGYSASTAPGIENPYLSSGQKEKNQGVVVPPSSATMPVGKTGYPPVPYNPHNPYGRPSVSTQTSDVPDAAASTYLQPVTTNIPSSAKPQGQTQWSTRVGYNSQSYHFVPPPDFY